MRETGWVEVASMRIDGDLAEVDVCAHASELDVTQPAVRLISAYTEYWIRAPLFLDHVQEIPMVDNPLEDRPQGEPVMSTERRGESEDRNSVLGSWGLSFFVRMTDCGMKV